MTEHPFRPLFSEVLIEPKPIRLPEVKKVEAPQITKASTFDSLARALQREFSYYWPGYRLKMVDSLFKYGTDFYVFDERAENFYATFSLYKKAMIKPYEAGELIRDGVEVAIEEIWDKWFDVEKWEALGECLTG